MREAAGRGEGEDRTFGPVQSVLALLFAFVFLGWLYLLLVGVPEAFKGR